MPSAGDPSLGEWITSGGRLFAKLGGLMLFAEIAFRRGSAEHCFVGYVRTLPSALEGPRAYVAPESRWPIFALASILAGEGLYSRAFGSGESVEEKGISVIHPPSF